MRVVAVEKVLWQWGGGFLSVGGFDVALFGLFDPFFHLDLFIAAGLLISVVAVSSVKVLELLSCLK